MNSQSGNFRYILLILPIFFVCENTAYAIDLRFQGLVEGYTDTNNRGFNNATHCGIDKVAGLDADILCTNFGEKEESIHSHDNVEPCSYALCNDCSNNDPNYVVVKHLLSDGSYLWSRYLHMTPQEDQNGIDILADYVYIAQSQLLGNEGHSGWVCGPTGIHLHYESNTSIVHGFSAAPSCNTGNPVAVSPTPYFGTDNPASIILPLLSRTESTPTTDNYNVYGIADTDIYGSLDINSTNINRSAPNLTNARIAVYNSGSRANLGAMLNTLVSRTDPSNPSSVTGNNTYQNGDYLFIPSVTDAAGERTGYPVKFSILANKNDRIVDNDQRNNDDNGSSYETTGGSGLNVPGYFLTATLHKGQSGDTALWCPNVTGNYNVFVHIPEYGATATNVVYSMGDTNFDSIDQTKNGGEWVQLTSSHKKEFEFGADDCIKLELSTAKKQEITATQLAAFDAVKFEYVAGNGGGKESETKLSIRYEKNARKPMTGDKINISCYFKPSGDGKKDIEYTISINEKTPLLNKSTPTTEPFILTADYEFKQEQTVTVSCDVGKKSSVEEKIDNIGSYSEPKKEGDIKEGDRIAVKSGSVDVYNCSKNDGDYFYSVDSKNTVSLGSQGNTGKVFFDKDGKKWRDIKWNTDVQINAANPCVAEDVLISFFDNSCFFDDFKGAIVSARQNVNCRNKNGNKIDWTKFVEIPSGTLGFSSEKPFYSDGYTWRKVSWYDPSHVDDCYSAENYLDIVDFDNTPYFESVGEMCKMGVVDGYTSLANKFGPHNTFSRKEVTKIMINLLPILKKDEVKGLPGFPEKDNKGEIINYENIAITKYKDDVRYDKNRKLCWYYSYIGKATAAGIIEGYSDEKFYPDNEITHIELAKMVVNSILFNEEALKTKERKGWPSNEFLNTNCVVTTGTDGKKRLDWSCYDGIKNIWPDRYKDWYCAHIYQSAGITKPIYDIEKGTFVDLNKEKRADKALRCEAIQAFYNAFSFRQENKEYSLRKCEILNK